MGCSIEKLFSVISFIGSMCALYFTWLNWRRSNRPLITAFLKPKVRGNQGTIFELIISNTGNRPALNVKLSATEKEINKLFEPGISEKRKALVTNNFSDTAEIPLLRNGEDLPTSFGASTPNPWLKYGTKIKIKIEYDDIDSRHFKTMLYLKVYVREGFGGGTWGEPEDG